MHTMVKVMEITHLVILGLVFPVIAREMVMVDLIFFVNMDLYLVMDFPPWWTVDLNMNRLIDDCTGFGLQEHGSAMSTGDGNGSGAGVARHWVLNGNGMGDGYGYLSGDGVGSGDGIDFAMVGNGVPFYFNVIHYKSFD